MLEDWQAGEMKPESPLRNGLVLEVKMPEAAEAERKFVKLKHDLKIHAIWSYKKRSYKKH